MSEVTEKTLKSVKRAGSPKIQAIRALESKAIETGQQYKSFMSACLLTEKYPIDMYKAVRDIDNAQRILKTLLINGEIENIEGYNDVMLRSKELSRSLVALGAKGKRLIRQANEKKSKNSNN